MALRNPDAGLPPVDDASPPIAASSSFPQTPEEFESDPRISFYKVDQKWVLEADDGSEFEWDGSLKRWIPMVS
jgi:HIV Tat-specific factor 1